MRKFWNGIVGFVFGVTLLLGVSSTLMPMMYVRMEHYLSTFIFWHGFAGSGDFVHK